MALFGKSQKVLDAEQALKQVFRQNPIVDQFIDYMRVLPAEAEAGYAWIHSNAEYGDKGIRKVKVDKRYIEVSNPNDPEAVDMALDCTKFGYKPMQQPACDPQFSCIPFNDVIALWCEVLKERMKEIYPQYAYAEIRKEPAGDAAVYSFQYVLPEYPWKAWF